MKEVYSLLLLASIFANQIKGNWAEETLSQMNLKQKVGQLFMVAIASDFNQPEESLATAMFKCPYKMDNDHIESLIQEYGIGGIIFLFKSTPEKQIALMNKLKSITQIPLLFGQDCEWGLAMRLYNTQEFPRNIDLGNLDDEQLTYEVGREIGRQCREMGLHINFAPVADVNVNPGNIVIGKRSFGADKDLVVRHAVAMMKGMKDSGILTCAKHFPGHGDTSVDSHLGLPVINHPLERIQKVELHPFRELAQAGVDAIMTAHIAFPKLDTSGRPATLSAELLKLREEIGFAGLMVTDGLGMQALTNNFAPGEIELEALLAGNDILLCPLDVPKAVGLILKAVEDGKITEQEIDGRVLKILRAKEKFIGEKAVEEESALRSINRSTSLLEKITKRVAENIK